MLCNYYDWQEVWIKHLVDVFISVFILFTAITVKEYAFKGDNRPAAEYFMGSEYNDVSENWTVKMYSVYTCICSLCL